jgi:hypothetical protein
VYASPAVERELGYLPGEVLGDGWWIKSDSTAWAIGGEFKKTKKGFAIGLPALA